MNGIKKIVIGLLVAGVSTHAIYATFRVKGLQTRLTRLEASQHQMQERHRLLKESYARFICAHDVTDQAFPRVLALVEQEDGADILSASQTNVRRNLVSVVQGE